MYSALLKYVVRNTIIKAKVWSITRNRLLEEEAGKIAWVMLPTEYVCTGHLYLIPVRGQPVEVHSAQ